MKTSIEAAEEMLSEICDRREHWIRFRTGRVMAEYVLDVALTMSRRAKTDGERAFRFACHWRWLTADTGSEADRIMERVCEHLWDVAQWLGREGMPQCFGVTRDGQSSIGRVATTAPSAAGSERRRRKPMPSDLELVERFIEAELEQRREGGESCLGCERGQPGKWWSPMDEQFIDCPECAGTGKNPYVSQAEEALEAIRRVRAGGILR